MKRLLILGLSLLMLLSACGKDPETADLENYVQGSLFNIRTNLRAANSQYELSRSKNELARADIIRTKVLYQYERYLQGLKDIKTDTAFVERLNETGVERATEAVKALDDYRKAMLKRDSHLTMRARSDAENAMNKVEKWQRDVWETARAKNIEVPADNVR